MRAPFLYDIFRPEPSVLGRFYDGVRSWSVGSRVVTMSYDTSETHSQGDGLFAYSSATVVYHRRGYRDISYRRGNLGEQCKAIDGQISLLPAGIPIGVRYHEPCEGLVVGLSTGLIAEVASDLGVSGGYPLVVGLGDPTLAAMSESFWASGSTSPVLLAALGKAMLVHIFERHLSQIAPNSCFMPSWLKAAQSYIRANLQRTISLDDLADAAGLSRAHFARSFKQATGLSPMVYVARVRAERARELILDQPETALSSIAAAVGFCDQSHFTHHFRKRFGITPAAFRRNPSTGIPKNSTSIQDRIGLAT